MYNIDRNTLVSLLKFDISLYIFSKTITFTYIYNIDLKFYIYSAINILIQIGILSTIISI